VIFFSGKKGCPVGCPVGCPGKGLEDYWLAAGLSKFE